MPLRAIFAAALVLAAAALAIAAPGAFALGNGVARTPPMGWNSWDHFGCGVDEQLVLTTADAIAASGMQRSGYKYVNLDDCWMARTRDASGNLRADPAKFPHGIPAVAQAVHAKGLSFGMYLSAGNLTCARYPGSAGHVRQDIAQLAAWGVDYVKIDWCYMPSGSHPPAVYAAYRQAVLATRRPMVLSDCIQGYAQPWTWGPRIGNLWRTTGDVGDDWRSVAWVIDANASLWPFAAPGGWNDPDMLQVGNRHLSDVEGRTQFSLWSILAAPLLAGNDVRSMSAATRATLTNAQVIRIDQDRAGRQGMRVQALHGHELWLRQLHGGDWALLLLNRTSRAALVTADLHRLAPLPSAATYRVRDLWAHHNGTVGRALRQHVPAHGVAFFRLRPR